MPPKPRDLVLRNRAPGNVDAAQQRGYGLAGTPVAVRDALKETACRGAAQLRFAFGDMTLEESPRSLELFAPAARPERAAA